MPAFKKKPKINRKSHKITNTPCTDPALLLDRVIIAFNSKYIDVFQINKDIIKNKANKIELKNEIQNCVNKDITSLAGAGFKVSDL